LDRTVSNVWLDSGSSYNIIAVLEPTRPTERWLSPIAATGTVAAGLNLAPTYFHQYLASFEYSVIGGGNAQAPTLAFPSMGKKNAVPITSSQDSWVDSGLEWNATNPLVMSTSSERWYSSSAKGLVSSPGKQSLRYYHQYSFTSSYSIVGGRGPTPVFLSSTSSGEDLKIQLALAPTKLWFDAEASWAVSKSITTSRTERWQSVDATTSGRATSPGTISPSYYHQYLVPVSSKSYGLGSISDLTLKSFSLGTQESNRLSTSGIEVWMDNGTKWTLGYPSLASAPGERWLASGEAGTVSNSGEISLLFYHQVSLSASYSIRGSAIGSKPPTLQSTSTGSPFSTQLTTFRSDYWLDFGVPYNVTGTLEGSSGKQRWLLRDTTPGTAINGTNVSALYYQQLLVNATYSVGGGNTFGFTAPKLDSMVFGRPYSVTLTREPVNAWLDAGAAYKITASLPARSPSERWQTQKDSGTISPSTIINPQYKLQYLVTLRTEPANGGSISPKVEWTDAGNSVTLSATANPRWTFKFWNGTGTEAYSGMNNPIPLVVNGPVNQTALFYPSLTITNGNEGVVELAYNNTAETIGVDSFKTFSVQPGSSVTISAGNHPIIYKLVGWDGLPNEPSAKVTFRVDSPLSIRPHYELDVLNIGLILAAITGMVVIFRRVLRR